MKKRGLIGGSALLIVAALAWRLWPAASVSTDAAPPERAGDDAPAPVVATARPDAAVDDAPEDAGAEAQALPTLKGEVVDASGGVAQADVSAVLRGTEHDAGCETQAQTRSVAGGSVTIDGLCPGQYDVRASHDGLSATAVVRLERGHETEVTLTLRTGTRLEVRVRDEKRAPVAGATVEAGEQHNGFWARATTDAKGLAVIDGLSAREHTLIARKVGYLDAWMPGRVLAAGHDEAQLVLLQGGSVEGTVLGPDGEALDGVDLKLGTPSHELNGVMDERVRGQSSDGGLFRLGLVRPGTYQLAAKLKGYRRLEKEVRSPGPRQTLVLTRGARLDGVFLDVDGQPVADAEILGRTADEQERFEARYTDGGFHAEGLGTGDWTVLGVAKRGDAGSEESAVVAVAKLTVRDQKAIWLTLELERGDAISGRCVEADGAPANTDVVAVEEGVLKKLVTRGFPMSSAEPGTLGFSRCRSSFRIDGLRPGNYRLLACGHKDEAPLVAAGTADVVLTCVPKGKLTWRAVDAQGRPVTRYAAFGSDDYDEHPDGRGEHAFEGELDRVLTIFAKGYAPLQRKVKAAQGQRLDLGDLVLTAERTVKGVVRDGSGQPVVGAELRFGVDGSEAYLRTRTAADGTFTLEEAPGTASELFVEHPGFQRHQQAVGAAQTFVEITLTAARQLSGAVVTRDGRALEGAKVVALRADPAWVDRGSDDVGDGHYALGAMPEGEVVLRLRATRGALKLSGFGPMKVTDQPVNDFVERMGGATFALRPVDGEGQPLDTTAWLIPGAPALGTVDAARKRVALEGLEADVQQGTLRFQSVPPGRWTAVVFLRRLPAKFWATPIDVAPAMPSIVNVVMPAGLY